MITAGHFTTEDLSADKGPNWEEEQRMYTTSSVAPVFVVHRLVHGGLLGRGSKVVLVSSEAGSIALRHPSEGGGNYAHHASKAGPQHGGQAAEPGSAGAGRRREHRPPGLHADRHDQGRRVRQVLGRRRR